MNINHTLSHEVALGKPVINKLHIPCLGATGARCEQDKSVQLLYWNESMKNLTVTEPTATMTSLELREIINAARQSHGESKVENSHFLKRIEDELEGELGAKKVFELPTGGRPMYYYDLTTAQAVQMLTREQGAARKLVATLVEDHQKLLSAYQEIDVDELEVDRFVYVIKNTLTGAYKVGISKDPEARLKQLQTGNDGELVLIGCKQGTFRDERLAHLEFAPKQIRSEWFQLTSSDVSHLLN